MNTLEKSEQLLGMVTAPAFSVRNKKIAYVNQAAQNLHICPQTPISQLLPDYREEWDSFRSGCLYLPVYLCGVRYGASITRHGASYIFVLDDLSGDDRLNALALAGNHLRVPLNNIAAILATHFKALQGRDHRQSEPVAQLRQSVTRLYKEMCNMCDSAGWIDQGVQKDPVNISSLFAQVMERCADTLSQNNVYIHRLCPDQAIPAYVNQDMLERALYNMVSNAVKYGCQQAFLEARLEQVGEQICISIENTCAKLEQSQLANAFTQYRRDPSLSDGSQGMGLGMTLIRSAALAHDGAVLLYQPEPNKVCVTLTLRPEPAENMAVVRHKPDRMANYAGVADLALLELCEILSTQSYQEFN